MIEMSKRVSFYGLIGLGSLCLVFLFFNQRYGNPLKHRIQPILAVDRSWEENEPRSQPLEILEPLLNTDDIKELDESNASFNVIQQVIDLQRRIIRDDMMGYKYPNGKYNISAKKLEDLVMENNGRPIRSIILTTWRSGSTFLGDVLTAHPGNFYHYEPLLDFDIVQIRGPPLAEKALKNIRALLNCDYADLDHYIEFGKTHSWLFNHNAPLWKQCLAHKSICYNHKFLSGMCRLFPFQSMKLVRLRLRIAQDLLADDKLGVRLVLLVRDPRGTLQSRKHRDFCPTSPDCSDPALLCADMVSDYNVAVDLQKKYPNTFRVIRYEDLAVEPYTHVEELSKFYGLDFHPDVRKFLDTHTKSDAGGVSSTFRNSKAAPFHWRNDLEFEEVEEIQRSCIGAMENWGYVPAMNATHQREFNPITDYVLNL